MSTKKLQILNGFGEFVKHTAQTLTEEQKAQARENIDAASSTDLQNIADYIDLDAPLVRYNEPQSLTDEQKAQALENIGAVATPSTASVGQTIVVKTVDSDGTPTEWTAVDLPSGGSGGSTDGAVLYTPQTLTQEQKEQVITNLGLIEPISTAYTNDQRIGELETIMQDESERLDELSITIQNCDVLSDSNMTRLDAHDTELNVIDERIEYLEGNEAIHREILQGLDNDIADLKTGVVRHDIAQSLSRDQMITACNNMGAVYQPLLEVNAFYDNDDDYPVFGLLHLENDCAPILRGIMDGRNEYDAVNMKQLNTKTAVQLITWEEDD